MVLSALTVKLVAATVAVSAVAVPYASFKQQDAPVSVACGVVEGGWLDSAEWARQGRESGEWVRNVIDNPAVYRDERTIKRNLDGMWEVTERPFKSFYLAANGKPQDPKLAAMEKERAQAVADAAAACCPTPAPPEDEPEEFDPRMASFQAGTSWTPHQRGNAAAIVKVAAKRGVGERGAVVGLATAMQESTLNNVNHGDSAGPDSRGLFQQRDPWGPLSVRMNPTGAAGLFFDALVKVDGWQQMSVTRAAQAVQRSAYPDAYAKWEDDARELLAAAGGFGAAVIPEAKDPEAPGYAVGGCVPVGEDSEVDISDGRRDVTPTPGGWDFPNQRSVDAAIGWMRSQDARNAGGWQARCLAAVGQAYGHSGTTQVNGRFWARDQWTAMPDRYKSPGMGNPPKGALVFWDASMYGHIAISNGDGRVWTTDPPGRSGQVGLVPISTIDTWGERLGHGAPFFIGKTGEAA